MVLSLSLNFAEAVVIIEQLLSQVWKTYSIHDANDVFLCCVIADRFNFIGLERPTKM